ncbi:hypothetical protein QQX98_004856 [Neonectria punicea]|uniref:Uncharacterized protein n=1 Tax=Neonectria punicea TaxID=979145 RepID=A0ABR1H7C1_9HYPO
MSRSLFATPSGNSFASVSATDESRSALGDGFAEHRAVGPAPTPLKLALAEHRTAVLTTAISGHFAHYQYLSRFRRIKLEAPRNRRTLVTVGLSWALVYIGVLSTITIAQRDVSRHADRLLRRPENS